MILQAGCDPRSPKARYETLAQMMDQNPEPQKAKVEEVLGHPFREYDSSEWRIGKIAPLGMATVSAVTIERRDGVGFGSHHVKSGFFRFAKTRRNVTHASFYDLNGDERPDVYVGYCEGGTVAEIALLD